MRPSRHALPAFCILLLGALAPAHAQSSNTDQKFDLKPLVPPVFPLPSNTQVTPGTQNTFGQTPGTGGSAAQPSASQPPSNPGFKITIPK